MHIMRQEPRLCTLAMKRKYKMAIWVSTSLLLYLGSSQMGREDVGDKAFSPCGEELQHHSCSREYGKDTANANLGYNNSEA